MNKLISVEISSGLFSSERTVRFDTIDGKTSVFVSSSQVDEERQTLNVVLLDQDDMCALILISSQSGDIITKVLRGIIK